MTAMVHAMPLQHTGLNPPDGVEQDVEWHAQTGYEVLMTRAVIFR